MRNYQLDKRQHYRYVKQNGYQIETNLSYQQSVSNKNLASANPNEMERAHMNIKINQKKSKAVFKKLFEDGKLYYGCRDSNFIDEATHLADQDGSEGELTPKAERRKQDDLQNVIRIMEGSLRWGLEKRAKEVIPLEVCLQTYRK